MESFMKITARIRVGAVVASAALVLGSSVGAYASNVPSSKATAGAGCARAGLTAPSLGVEGSTLTCTSVTTGSYKGQLRWWYADMKPLTSIEFVSSSAIGGGYGKTAIAVGDALKAEGLLGSYTVKYFTNAPLGVAYFQGEKNRKDMLLMTGYAMPGGLASGKSTLDMLNSKPLAAFLREGEAIAVSMNSPYKSINDLLVAIKANPKIALGGGNPGGVDHVTIATLAATVGVAATDLNYIAYSGGGTLTPDIISGRVAAGVSGTTEFASYVAAGKMRILGITTPKPLTTIKGKTLIQQGLNFTFGNWRGLLAPADLPAADHLNMLKVIDTAHGSPSWTAMLKANSWIDEYRVGTPFATWLKTEVAAILKLGRDSKLY